MTSYYYLKLCAARKKKPKTLFRDIIWKAFISEALCCRGRVPNGIRTVPAAYIISIHTVHTRRPDVGRQLYTSSRTIDIKSVSGRLKGPAISCVTRVRYAAVALCRSRYENNTKHDVGYQSLISGRLGTSARQFVYIARCIDAQRLSALSSVRSGPLGVCT